MTTEFNYAAVFRMIYPDGKLRTQPEVDYPKSDVITKVADVLNDNIVRLKCLAGFPVNCIANGSFSPLVEVHARFNLTGDINGEPDKETLRGEMDRIQSSFSRDVVHKLISVTAESYDLLLRDRRQTSMQEACDAHFGSLILWSYTLFESFAGDLWIDAVNAYPHQLAKNVFGAKLPDLDDGTRQQQPVLPLADLVHFDFDLRNRMGDLLKQQKRVSFDSLKLIKEAYDAAFPNPESHKQRRPSQALRDIFDKFDGDISALESVRNLIAHRGGRIDKRFAFKMKKIQPNSSYEAQIGEVLPLTGDDVERYANAAMGASKALLAYVDQWIVKYGKSETTGDDQTKPKP